MRLQNLVFDVTGVFRVPSFLFAIFFPLFSFIFLSERFPDHPSLFLLSLLPTLIFYLLFAFCLPFLSVFLLVASFCFYSLSLLFALSVSVFPSSASFLSDSAFFLLP